VLRDTPSECQRACGTLGSAWHRRSLHGRDTHVERSSCITFISQTPRSETATPGDRRRRQSQIHSTQSTETPPHQNARKPSSQHLGEHNEQISAHTYSAEWVPDTDGDEVHYQRRTPLTNLSSASCGASLKLCAPTPMVIPAHIDARQARVPRCVIREFECYTMLRASPTSSRIRRRALSRILPAITQPGNPPKRDTLQRVNNSYPPRFETAEDNPVERRYPETRAHPADHMLQHLCSASVGTLGYEIKRRTGILLSRRRDDTPYLPVRRAG
jgi:hypothetical protein